jgi:CubicO group peptidase (beta-lactamase class C family)
MRLGSLSLSPMPAMRCAFRAGFGCAVVVCLLAMAGPSVAGSGVAATPAVDLDAAVKTGESLPRMRSLLVSWRGELIVERYFHATRATSLQDIKSASKSLISALVGIAIGRGVLPGVDAPIASYFPDLSGPGVDARKKQITIADLLTMRSGLASTSRQNYGAWVQSPNWVRYVLSRPLLNPPGEQMDYSTGNTHLLSAIVTKASGEDTWSFAEEALAKPLGFTLARWTRDPQGIYFGGNEMLMTPREMLKFGELYLRRGQIDGRQIVPAAWVADSFTARTQSPISGHQYGYGWWMDEMEGHRVYFAWGFGGQYIFVVPDLELVVVTTSSVSLGEDRREHRDAVYDLVDHLVVGSVAAAAERSTRAPDSGVQTGAN